MLISSDCVEHNPELATQKLPTASWKAYQSLLPCFLAACLPAWLLKCYVMCPRSWHDGQLLTRYAYLSGALCGVTEGVAFAPFQVIKVRRCLCWSHRVLCVLLQAEQQRARCIICTVAPCKQEVAACTVA